MIIRVLRSWEFQIDSARLDISLHETTQEVAESFKQNTMIVSGKLLRPVVTVLNYSFIHLEQ